MNGKRCAVLLGDRCVFEGKVINLGYDYSVTVTGHAAGVVQIRRIFGSHSEAKRELPKWRDEWPHARIVDEGEL